MIDLKKLVTAIADGTISVEDGTRQINVEYTDKLIYNKTAKANQEIANLTLANETLTTELADSKTAAKELATAHTDEVEAIKTSSKALEDELTALKTEHEKLNTEFTAASEELGVFKSTKQGIERQEALKEIIGKDVMDDALTLAKAKGLITDESTNEELVEAMTKFAEEKPMFKFNKVVTTPEGGNGEGGDKTFNEQDEFEKLKKSLTGETKDPVKKEAKDFNEADAFADLRAAL